MVIIHIRHTKTLVHVLKQAIFVTSTSHTQRSYLAYQRLAKPLNIKIHPVAYLGKKYQRNDWWYEGHGAYDFFYSFKAWHFT